MTELMPLFLRTGNKEALFAVFWATLGREPGKLADVDFATLRDLAERSGVKLTESQVRKRVDELKKLGILDVAPRRERGRFDLYVYRPAPFAAEAEKPEPATPLFDAAFGVGVESFAKPTDAAKPTVPVFAAVSETETRPETVAKTYATDVGVGRIDAAPPQTLQTPTVAEVRVVRPTSTIPAVTSVASEPTSHEPVASPLEEINNNKYIKNKTINKPAKDLETETQAAVDASSVAGTQPGLEPERRPDVADVRTLVDFESPKVAALRREIAEAVWEPTVHPDLIDRLTAAVVLRVGVATRSTVFALIREARDERSLYERSNGRAGKRTIWQTATLRLKRLFENAGWVWSPTRFADEPRPSDVCRQARPLERSQRPKETPATPERSVDELLSVAVGFEPSELDLSFADFSRLVARRRGIADACESRGVALEIRNALRELAKRELATA